MTEKTDEVLLQSVDKSKYLDVGQIITDIPELVYERTATMQALARELHGFGPSHNMYVYGVRGSGKSTLTKRAIEKSAGEKTIIYVNCRLRDTAKKVYENILYEFQHTDPTFFLYNDNQKFKMLKDEYDLLAFYMTHTKKPIFIILDEFDIIALKSDVSSQNFLYKFLRMPEEADNSDYKYTVCLLTNKMDIKKSLPGDVSDFLNPTIILPAYDAPDIFEIIRKRVNYCMKPGVITDEACRLISKYTVQYYLSDARKAIILLGKAIKIADDRHAPQITTAIIADAHLEVQDEELEREVKALDDNVKIYLYSILSLIEEQGNVPAFTLQNSYEKYIEFCDNTGIEQVSYKQVTNYMYDDIMPNDLVTVIPDRTDARKKVFQFIKDVKAIKNILIPYIPKVRNTQEATAIGER
jgi:Cdc6-like AAA superfamily ATPase